MTSDRVRRGAWGVAAVLVALGLLCRCIALERWPGLNGDEAWYGVQALDVLGGAFPALATPTGNAVNPFFLGLQVAVHGVLPASTVTVRLPALVSGVAAVLLAWPLLRPLGRGSAAAGTVLLACLPLAIAYSRFGWDQSQGLLAGLLACGGALRGRPLWTALALVAAFVVHPSNLFVAPFLLALLWVRIPPGLPARARMRHAAALGLGAAALVAGLAVLVPVGPRSEGLLSELASLPHLLIWTLRMLSGTSIYTHVSAPPAAGTVLAHDAAGAVLAGILLGPGLGRAIRARDADALAATAGLVASFLLFAMIAGRLARLPDAQRYGLFLVVPALIAALRLGRRLAPEAVLGGAVVAGALLLVSFASGYLEPLATQGGRAHRAFRTGAVEPKTALVTAIRAATPDAPRVAAEDWWTFWPIHYLGSRPPPFQVSYLGAFRGDPSPEKVEAVQATLATGAWVVGFEGGFAEALVARAVPAAKIERLDAWDPTGRRVLSAWRIASPRASWDTGHR
ncbi:MAG: hypothetical protein JXB39_01475 [Deltaproteobacteria bacterium]|nr:hypothetical protein [Deltaproteobacteria bacterium]